MRVFISWSGNKGRNVAKILHAWLPRVLQAIKPFFSPENIAKGARWGSEVGGELEASQIGIVIVTRESLSAPWIMFEAGALSKNVGRAKVVPILVDLAPGDVRGPLMQFQCATVEPVEIKRLLRMLNSELKDRAVTDDVLESAFSMWWPAFEKQIAEVSRSANVTQVAHVSSEREILEELLGLSRLILRQQAAKSQSTAPSRLVTALSSAEAERRTGSLTLALIRKRLDHGGNLAGANLMNLDLSQLDFTGANLRGANLVRTKLTGAKLINADLEAANLEGAVLDGVDLAGARIPRTNLWRASMHNVKNLSLVQSMDEANFFQVRLNARDRKTVAEHHTLSVSNYPELLEYYRKQGMTKAELTDLFLWTAHSYPGEGLWGAS